MSATRSARISRRSLRSDNNVPFLCRAAVADDRLHRVRRVAEIPIEQRDGDEVASVSGLTTDGRIETVRVVPDGSPVANYAFDVTPARLVTALITERGVIAPDRAALAAAFPERVAALAARPAAE